MMRRLLAVVLMLCVPATPVGAYLADIPVEMREENWTGSRGEGSCAWASTVMALRWAGQFELASWYREHQGNGAYDTQLMDVATEYHLAFSATETGDRTWMEWALRNRLVVMCPFYPAHMICVVGELGEYIVIMDNNHIGGYRFVEKERFYRDWRNRYSGFAMVFLYNPAPPWPKAL